MPFIVRNYGAGPERLAYLLAMPRPGWEMHDVARARWTDAPADAKSWTTRKSATRAMHRAIDRRLFDGESSALLAVVDQASEMLAPVR